MASFNICNSSSTANLHQTECKLSTMVASTPYYPGRNITTTSFKPKSSSSSSSSSKLLCKSLHQRHAAHIVNHIHKPMEEPSISSPTTNQQAPPLRIGILGLGAFGQFLASAFQRQGHNVLATSRSDYSEYCQEHGIEFFRHLNDLCEAQPDVLLVCSSILSTENVVRGIPFHLLKPDTIIADVLSVKQFSKKLFSEVVPSGFGILCTHPMFGKYSGNKSWEGLRFVYDKVRVSENSVQDRICQHFLSIFQDEGCRMIEMSCEDHDKYAAESQFVTHTVARIVSNMNLEPTPIDTKGFERLMELSQNTVSHGSDLYDGLFLYNVNAAEQIERLERAFDAVKQNLFAKLRDSYATQIQNSAAAAAAAAAAEENRCKPPSQFFLPISEKVLKDVSSFSMLPEQVKDDYASVQRMTHH